MSGHVGNLSTYQQETLNKFRQNVENILTQEELEDDYYMLRWLRARDFDLQKTEQMLRKHCRFRKEWKIDRVLAEDSIPEIWKKYFPGNYVGYNKDKGPLYLFCTGRFDLKGIYHSLRPEELTKYSLSIAEEGTKLCQEQSQKHGKRIEGVTIIQDMSGFTVSNFYKPAVVHFAKVLGMFEDNYPEFMKDVFVVNGNYQQVLLKHIHAESLPKIYGGNKVDDDGDPQCSAIVGHGGEIPTSYYRSSNNKVNSRSEEDYSTVTIARGDTLKLQFDINIPGTLMKWEFKTENHNIGFGVVKVIENEDGTIENYEVIPIARRSCQSTLEEGNYYCEDAGTYILCFDNSFSWLTGKSLHYAIDILPPDEAITD
ncbi:uncharacterized protein TRIADDRAFT_60316 [Trichoplax adhaerens]|uniref:CRAL-TRIO domain-containing protein n=1 Tax=Trichoplax adhaerens TaxID=10228 RepID=B3S7W2_TRIAD|nr:hypothetical protein TRIADDRAFT_60316 [Trichoplax adhaerens]EDV21365.1 hypothetical protein TRIADDRAFT_60316 [Trichoplax adhaerens]|eukprot:XP_002116332.1 hypothetical protein TRIADDRAFT_60316 [Trichoplax adhaerens]